MRGGNGTRARRWIATLTAAMALVAAGACSDDSADRDEATDVEPGGDASGAIGDADWIFPGDDWDTADPEDLGFDAQTLETLAEEARTGESSCLLVSRQGQVVGEWYWRDTEPDTTHQVFSVTKSYTSTLVGIAQDEGHLDIDDKVSDYIDEWVGTPSEDITIRDILSNISGRTWNAIEFDRYYVTAASTPNVTEWAIDLGQTSPPGEEWVYNDGAIQTLEQVLEEAVGQDPAAYAEEKIFEPIGASNTEMGHDESGNTYMFWDIQSSCRDMARFGYLFLRDGVWDGEQVLPEGWVDEATGQPSQDLNSGYGYLWWINRPGDQPGGGNGEGSQAEQGDGNLPNPEAPEDMYWAQGLGGQTIQVHPETETVVVRLGTGTLPPPYGSENTAQIVTEALVDP